MKLHATANNHQGKQQAGHVGMMQDHFNADIVAQSLYLWFKNLTRFPLRISDDTLKIHLINQGILSGCVNEIKEEDIQAYRNTYEDCVFQKFMHLLLKRVKTYLQPFTLEDTIHISLNNMSSNDIGPNSLIVGNDDFIKYKLEGLYKGLDHLCKSDSIVPFITTGRRASETAKLVCMDIKGKRKRYFSDRKEPERDYDCYYHLLFELLEGYVSMIDGNNIVSKLFNYPSSYRELLTVISYLGQALTMSVTGYVIPFIDQYNPEDQHELPSKVMYNGHTIAKMHLSEELAEKANFVDGLNVGHLSIDSVNLMDRINSYALMDVQENSRMFTATSEMRVCQNILDMFSFLYKQKIAEHK